MAGVCVLTGIGFIMSFFIGDLAFQNYPDLNNEVIFAVLLASLIGFLTIFTAIKLRD